MRKNYSYCARTHLENPVFVASTNGGKGREFSLTAVTMVQNRLQKLTARQQRGLKALLTEPNTRAAARASGIGETTLWTWLSDPFFAGSVSDARARLFEGAIASLQQAMGEAVETLRGVLRDAEARPGEKVSAARAILEFSLRSRELFELEQRMSAIEAAVKSGRAA